MAEVAEEIEYCMRAAEEGDGGAWEKGGEGDECEPGDGGTVMGEGG
jgi:hypothetical protein